MPRCMTTPNPCTTFFVVIALIFMVVLGLALFSWVDSVPTTAVAEEAPPKWAKHRMVVDKPIYTASKKWRNGDVMYLSWWSGYSSTGLLLVKTKIDDDTVEILISWYNFYSIQRLH